MKSALKFWPLIQANLLRRPARLVLTFIAVTAAFTLYGLTLGEAEGLRRMAAEHHAVAGPGFLLGALAVSAIGFGLVLFLTANAMAQGVRLRLGEFGVLKAIGFSHLLILILIATEAALPCLAGAVAGLVAAKLLFAALQWLLPPLAMFPAPVYTPAILAAAAALALGIGGISGALPASRIVRLDVMAALAGGLRPTAAPRRDADTVTVPRQSTAAPPSSGKIGLPPILKADQHLLRQIAVVTRIGLSTLSHRAKGALAVVVPLAIVTLAMFPGLIIAEALQRGNEEQGRPDRAMVLSADAQINGFSPFNSFIPAVAADIIRAAPGVAKGADGAPLADAQTGLHAVGGLGPPRIGSGTAIDLIGMEPAGRIIRTDIILVAGRWPRPGQRELAAGVRAAQTYNSLGLGKRLQLKVGPRAKPVNVGDWRVVGIFSTNSFFDANAIAPADMVRAAIGRDGANVIVVQLTSAADFERFRGALAANPALHVTAVRQSEYYRRLGQVQTRVAVILEVLIGALLGMGAMAGVIHVMHITIESREGEIGVLRAIGFDATAAAASVLLEAMALALAGALLGVIILWFWLDGQMFAGTLPLAITFRLAAEAVGWAWGIAILGALPAARRVAILSLPRALQR